MSVLVVVMAFASGVGVGWLWRARRVASSPATVTTAADAQNHYGHPWSPVAELRKRLCRPPTGHVWEIKVTTNDQGHHIMTLTLVNVAPGTNVDSASVDLTWYKPHGTTWVRYWDEYRILGKGEFTRSVTGPLVDWAQMLTDKMTTAGQATDYRIG